jgi:ribonuclease PH
MRRKMMISGDYEVLENKVNPPAYGERIITVKCHVVVDDYSENNATNFFEELQTLLNKYAI